MADLFPQLLVVYLITSLLLAAGLTVLLALVSTGESQLRSDARALMSARITDLNGGRLISRPQSLAAQVREYVESLVRFESAFSVRTQDPTVAWARRLQQAQSDDSTARSVDYLACYLTVEALSSRARSPEDSQLPLARRVRARVDRRVRRLSEKVGACSTLEELRDVHTQFVARECRRLRWQAVRSSDYRRLFHPIYNSMIDCVARGTTAGLLVAACLGLSAAGVDQWLSETARYPVLGGAVGSLIFASLIIQTFVDLQDKLLERPATDLVIFRRPILAAAVFPALATLLIGLFRVVQLQLQQPRSDHEAAPTPVSGPQPASALPIWIPTAIAIAVLVAIAVVLGMRAHSAYRAALTMSDQPTSERLRALQPVPAGLLFAWASALFALFIAMRWSPLLWITAAGCLVLAVMVPLLWLGSIAARWLEHTAANRRRISLGFAPVQYRIQPRTAGWIALCLTIPVWIGGAYLAGFIAYEYTRDVHVLDDVVMVWTAVWLVLAIVVVVRVRRNQGRRIDNEAPSVGSADESVPTDLDDRHPAPVD